MLKIILVPNTWTLPTCKYSIHIFHYCLLQGEFASWKSDMLLQFDANSEVQSKAPDVVIDGAANV